MNINNTDSIINDNSFTGAGILPYAKNKKGKLVFLLGKERNGNNKYKNNYYCDFGGGRENNENPIETAIREFSEESMDALNNIDFFKKIINKSKFIYNNKYYEFIIKIKYNDDIVESYNRIMKKFSKCNVCYSDNKYITCGIFCPNVSGLCEKTEFRWFTPIEILHTYRNMMRPVFLDTFKKLMIDLLK